MSDTMNIVGKESQEIKFNATIAEFEPSWNAVYAVSLGVACLIISEFLPVSLLTPMAKNLNVSEGTAGQAISVTAIVAMVSSLFMGSLTKKLDRRWVLLAFCVLQVLSNVVVAISPNFTFLLAGRILLGVGLGGFWGMSAATAMRLVPPQSVPKALSVIFGAVSVATVAAAPLGSYLGTLMGWRNVFFIASGLSACALIWQAITLPSMPTQNSPGLNTVLKLLKRPSIKGGMLATFFMFIGYASLFTYLRPFLEKVTGVDNDLLSILLLGFGIANLIGTVVSKYLFEWSLPRSLILMPFFMGCTGILLVIFGNIIVVAFLLIALWGMFLGVIQVGWTAWLTRAIPDETESGGGLQIAIIQLAITTGAAIGGVVMNRFDVVAVFLASAVFTLGAALVALAAFKEKK